ncbi:MAG: hypothetical protein FWD31_00750 [Planctomycetaceae bacterium]|nr:hypothetical protein [Planctomycetaceae bacterium]
MLISTKATDTIYQAVLHLLKQQGVEENETLQQDVLLGDDIFLGYRFQTPSLQIDWLAQHDILVLKNNEGRILLQKQLSSRKTESNESATNGEHRPFAA